MEGMNEAAAEPSEGPDGLTEERRGRMRRWIAALRSGEFPQARGHLATGSGFCCLGVACEVAMAAGFPMIRKPFPMIRKPGITGFLYLPKITIDGVPAKGSSRVLPELVAEWFGLPVPNSTNPYLEVPRQVTVSGRYRMMASRFPASVLNDDARMTFADIADCFEYTFLRADWEAGRGQGES